MVWYDMIWYDLLWYDIWYDMIWYDMIWYDMIWYDMIWYDLKQNLFLLTNSLIALPIKSCTCHGCGYICTTCMHGLTYHCQYTLT